MEAKIKSDLLIDLGRAGRNVLAYIIDTQLGNSTITLSRVEIVSYFENRISSSYASTQNATRGIKDLLDKEVISRVSGDKFTINTSKLKLDGSN